MNIRLKYLFKKFIFFMSQFDIRLRIKFSLVFEFMGLNCSFEFVFVDQEFNYVNIFMDTDVQGTLKR